MGWQCHYCQTQLSVSVITKNRLCPTCGSDLHACKNCHFYDENLSSKCKEPDSPWVRDRSAHNDCTFFEQAAIELQNSRKEKSQEILSEAEKAKAAFRALFRPTEPN